jgi:hypothetical protein
LINATQSNSQGEIDLVTRPKAVIHRIPITRARINLGQVARRAHIDKEYFILEKDGIPVAAIMNAEELEDYLEARDPRAEETHSEELSGISSRQGAGRRQIPERAAHQFSEAWNVSVPDARTIFSTDDSRIRQRFPKSVERESDTDQEYWKS